MQGNLRSLSFAVAAVTAGILFSADVVRADGPSNDSARVAALEARLAQLEAQQSTADRAVEQSRAIDAAIVDADKKAQFLQADGFTSGWDKGFKVGSADGAYLIQPYAQFQFRYVNNSSEGIFEDEADVQDGFEIRRTKLGIKGNAHSEDLTYDFRFAFNRNGGDAFLENAFIQYMFADAWGFRVGQWKADVYREESISSSRQLAAERSLVNELLGGAQTDYVQGVALLYKQDAVRGEVAFTDGDASLNTNYRNSGEETGQNFGATARVNYLVTGNFDAANDFTALKTKEDLVVLGAGAGFEQSGDSNLYRGTVDVQYENAGGLSLYAAGLVNFVTDDGSTDLGGGGDDTTDYGGLAQAGYLFPNTTWEAFGRYSYTGLDDDVAGDDDTFHEITVGVNKYFSGHDAKMTIDLGYLPNGSPSAVSGNGVTDTTEEQVIIRGQFQLLL